MPSENVPGNKARITWTKPRLLAAFWSVQFVVIFSLGVLWRVLGESQSWKDGKPFGQITFAEIRSVVLEPRYLTAHLTAVGIMTLLQAALLMPVYRPRARNERSWPLWLSIGIGGLGVMVLGLGLLLGIAQAVDNAGGIQVNNTVPGSEWIVLIVWTSLCWILGSWLLVRFCKRALDAGVSHEDVLAQIASRLFLGTIIEVAAIMPIDVMNRRKTGCYCWSQSYWALTILGGAGLLLIGPVIVLPMLARRRKRWWAGRCDACGYDLSSLIAAHRESKRTLERCPECGSGWKSSSTPAPAPTAVSPPSKQRA